jgi:hypothetical protein
MLLLMASAVQAQTRATPRLPWGDPDIEGTWTNATLTLLQRPADLGAKQFPLTKSEGPVFEYACHEGNYAMTHILSGARAEEKAAAEAAKAQK